MDLITSLGAGRREVWSNLLEGRSGLTPLERPLTSARDESVWCGEIPQATWDELVSIIPGAGRARSRDLAVAVGRMALEQGQAWLAGAEPHEIGMVLSSAKGDMEHLELLRQRVPNPRHFDLFALAQDVARELGFKGPLSAVSNACASGLVAISQGARLIQSGEAKFVLVIGVETLTRFVVEGFLALRAVSSGPCKPFDKSRDGLSLGAGAGAVLLTDKDRQPRQALADINGWGCTNDATHITAPAKGGAGLQAAIRRALAMARLQPQDIGYINAHGTGTVFNDEMEAQAYYRVFGADSPRVVSFKGYMGHTLGAAGVIEAILSVMVLRSEMSPASLGFRELGVGQPLCILTENTDLPNLRHILTTKIGFGGVNAVMVLGKPGA